MTSAVHSPPSTSSDVVLHPHPLNHLNHNNNHSESTSSPTKSSLKRTRSPSLTRDSPTSNNDSLMNNTETPTKRSRKKRNTIDIDQSLGRDLSAEKLFIYSWPLNSSSRDFYVLQEQICDYLALKSFKRKYPDISRRVVDLHEREYLKSENVVTETQCDLGLTALKIEEVLQLMSNDYPEKHHQFNHIWQQKRRTLLASAPILLSASISNHLSANPSLDNGEKLRPPIKSTNTLRTDLIRSAMEYNTQLQRERQQDRKACFDLQTMQIHFPSNRQFRLPPERTKVGSYPLALVPGQYQDSYIKYSSHELKYMPINTALYYYPKPTSLVHSERFNQQGASSDDEEESTRPTLANPSTPQSPLIVNGMNSHSNGPSSARLPKPSNSQISVCHMCKIEGEDESEEDLMTCTSCQQKYHPLCLDVNEEMLNIIKTYSWQCIDCKSCAKCSKTHDEANMMFCDRCDRGYHTYCVGLDAIPDGSWQCSICDPGPTTKLKRGRPSNRSSSRQQTPTTTTTTSNSPKSDLPPTRASSRRNRQTPSTPLSPNHSSNSSSADLQNTTNSPSMNLVLTRHQQQWTTTPSNTNNNNNHPIPNPR